MKDDSVYLRHVLECIEYVEAFTAGGRDVFLCDRKGQDAVLRNLQTMAESMSKLSDATKRRGADVDWRGIGGFRNVLVHNYLGLNMTRVWEIVERDLPPLKQAVVRLLGE